MLNLDNKTYLTHSNSSKNPISLSPKSSVFLHFSQRRVQNQSCFPWPHHHKHRLRKGRVWGCFTFPHIRHSLWWYGFPGPHTGDAGWAPLMTSRDMCFLIPGSKNASGLIRKPALPRAENTQNPPRMPWHYKLLPGKSRTNSGLFLF